MLLNMINFFMIYIASDEAQINSAAVLSLNSLSTFGVALLFYIVYGEKLKKKHMVGLLLMVSSALTMGFSKLSISNRTGDTLTF